MDITEMFWNASLEEIKQGYIETDEHYICLLCGSKFEKGIIYKDEDMFFEAWKYVKRHIEKAHGSVFLHLIQLDKKITGLTDHQNRLLRLFYQGKSDAEIKNEMEIGSTSTIRNHRFALKEKERQSRVFIAMMELLKEKNKAAGFVEPHKTAKMVDDRYNITTEENEKQLKKYFPEGTDGPIKTFEVKEKHKLIILREIAKRFKSGQIYSEKEVNEILKTAYHDYVTLRRYMIEYGFLERKPDGSQYWLKADDNGSKEVEMDRRAELRQLYKDEKIQAGVYQIKNTVNQKVLVLSTTNLKTINGKKFSLEMGSFINKELQKEWKEFGEEAFVFEVLEVLKTEKDEHIDVKDALKKLEQKWLDKLQPYGERGYNKKKEK